MNLDLKRHLLISFSIIIGAMAVAFVILYYLAGDISKSVDKIVADRTLVAQQTGALGMLAGLKGDAAQAAIYQAEITRVLPTQDGLIGFGQWFTGLASANQVTVQFSFQGSGTQPSGAVPGTIPLSLQVTGSLDNIAAFLQQVEATAPGFLFRLDSFDLTQNGAVYQLSGSGEVFFQ